MQFENSKKKTSGWDFFFTATGRSCANFKVLNNICDKHVIYRIKT